MKNNQEHISPEEKEFFDKTSIKFSKSKNDIWANLEDSISKTSTTTKKRGKIISLNRWTSIAAGLAILIGLTSFAKFYTTSINVNLGETKSIKLPDGSTVYMNSGTSLSYQPFWWYFSREIKMEGEAYFEVEKGSKFSVHSQQGITSVLGTSFNISSFGNSYEVFCNTGKVSIETPDFSEKVIITPGQKSGILNGSISIVSVSSFDSEVSWKNNKFKFNNTPFKQVIEEIERHYDTQIKYPKKFENFYYSGSFEYSKNVKDAVEMISIPFGLKVKSESNTFVLSE